MSPENFHFGYIKNNIGCSCGRHFGCGAYMPEQRAAMAARMRETMPTLMTADARAFLADFERYHGTVHYTMGVIGTNSGEFVKSHKGQPLNGPIFDYAYDMAARKAA